MSEKNSKFQKLTPLRDADIGIYSEALNYVFENDDLRNIAVSGAYSAGKSSVLESYKAKHPNKRFLHISLAHFEEAKEDTSTTAIQQIEISESMLEGKILNQLIHQISPSRIPQTNFRIKQQINPKKVWLMTITGVVFILSLLLIFFFAGWQTYIASISTDWIKSALWITTRNSSPLFAGAVCITLLGILLHYVIKVQINKGIFKRISADKFEIEIFEGCDDSYFDKYLNEVLYLFDQCESDVIVFEDMDRYNANLIFERLREVNNLINVQRNKQSDFKPLRFFYLLRDDIFISKDRTKFFDLIIPIVPVIDGSNSYDQFIKHLTDSCVLGLFDESFLQGLSLYVDDMRILKNICNEFLIYNSRLNITELHPNKLMAMVTYKNLFPRDFSELQLGRGFVFTLFDKKDYFAAEKISDMKSQIDKLLERIEAAKKESLQSVEELSIIFNSKKQKINKSYYYSADTQRELQQVQEEETRRKQAIEDNTADRISEIEDEIREIESQIALVSKESLHEIITRENIDAIFSVTSKNEVGVTSDFKSVRGNAYFDLLKYLIRNGYIDESYADYMTYFYEHSLSRTDKIFLRSIADQIKKEANYPLKEPQKVFARLDISVFKQPEILNYDLLFYLLQESACNIRLTKADESPDQDFDNFPRFTFTSDSLKKEHQCLMTMIDQVLEMNYASYLQSVFYSVNDSRLNYLVNLLNATRKDCLTKILTNKTEFAVDCKDDFAFRSLISTPMRDLVSNESLKIALSTYISNHPSFLDETRFTETKLREMFGDDATKGHCDDIARFLIDISFVSKLEVLEVRFKAINHEKANIILFSEVYEKNLYELNFENISHFLQVQYGMTTTDEFRHMNYTLVQQQPDTPLAKYIEENIDNYIAVILSCAMERLPMT